MFFNHKRFEIVNLNDSTILGLNKENTLSFYIKDVFKATAITSVYYQAIKKTGRDETPIGVPVLIEDILSDIATFKYTPTDSSIQAITFRLSITDSDDTLHIIDIDTFSVK